MMVPTEARDFSKVSPMDRYEENAVVRRKREKFWTPSERAGLRALGDSVIYTKENGCSKQMIDLAISMVQSFVYWVRKTKEER